MITRLLTPERSDGGQVVMKSPMGLRLYTFNITVIPIFLTFPEISLNHSLFVGIDVHSLSTGKAYYCYS